MILNVLSDTGRFFKLNECKAAISEFRNLESY